MPLPKAKTPPKADKSDKPKGPVREVLYPDVFSELCVGEKALTADQMKVLLGWETEGEDKKFGADYFTTDVRGNKVRAHNNVTNRPLYEPNVQGLKQEILMRRWRFNGEPYIVGKSGLILNGQHQGTALVLAQEELDHGAEKEHWKTLWPTGIVSIDKLVVYGVDEDDAVVNTMDTCKPRTLADVIYRSEYFAKLKPTDRKNASNLCSHAIKFLWERTGADRDPYAPRRTHAESLDFIARHPSLLKAVKHIMEEDKGGTDSPSGKVSNWLPCGVSSGLMYLMAASKSDSDKYQGGSPPTEKLIDKSLWDKAEEFWVLLASGSGVIQPLRDALAGLHDPDTALGGTRDERLAVIVKAWNEWSSGGALTAKTLKVEYVPTVDGGRKLAEHPIVGGIDLGKIKVQEEEEEDTPDPTPEEIEAAKEKAKADKEAKKAEKKAAKESDLRAKQGDGGSAPTTPPVPPTAPAKVPPAKTPPVKAAAKGGKPPLKGGIGK